jgi:hypothetical protein
MLYTTCVRVEWGIRAHSEPNIDAEVKINLNNDLVIGCGNSDGSGMNPYLYMWKLKHVNQFDITSTPNINI